MPRRLIRVEAAPDAPIAHDWKKTNLVTILAGGAHDTYRCMHCGITGKRFGLSETITRDRKWRAAKYARCKLVLK